MKGSQPLPEGQEAELYDYTHAERAPGAAQQRRTTARWRKRCAREYERAFKRGAARAAAAGASSSAHARGFADYFSTARHAAASAAAAPQTVAREREVGLADHARKLHGERAAAELVGQAQAVRLLDRGRGADHRARRRRAPAPHVRARGRRRDRRLKARLARPWPTGASALGEAPASTRQEATSVAPFQLTETAIVPPGARPRDHRRARSAAVRSTATDRC